MGLTRVAGAQQIADLSPGIWLSAGTAMGTGATGLSRQAPRRSRCARRSQMEWVRMTRPLNYTKCAAAVRCHCAATAAHTLRVFAIAWSSLAAMQGRQIPAKVGLETGIWAVEAWGHLNLMQRRLSRSAPIDTKSAFPPLAPRSLFSRRHPRIVGVRPRIGPSRPASRKMALQRL